MILIKNGRVIDPVNGVDDVLDVLIENDKIVKVEKNITDTADTIVDATGKWVVPGLIDLHVHLREPGFTHKETLKTGSESACVGGVTTICAMPNTNPVIDSKLLVEYVVMKAEKECCVNVLPIGSITKGQKGEELASIGSMKEAGICAISEDGGTVRNAKLMKTAMQYSKMFDVPVFAHCEDLELKNKGLINEGEVAVKLGLTGISNDTEDVIVARDIMLANNVQSKLHICHVSTRGTVELIKEGKKTNSLLTAEVAPHHFTLVDEDIVDYDSNYKMSPPLRSVEDRASILEALKNDVIDVIATDHAPHHIDEKKCEFELACNGIVGLETLIPLTITELVNKNVITPKQFVEKTSVNPAKIININKGKLGIGDVADITIIDVTTKYKIDINEFKSKSKNSPFGSREVVGKATHTIVSGKIKQINGQLLQSL